MSRQVVFPALLFGLLLSACASEPESAGPPTPDVGALPESVRAQVERAWERFREAPEDAASAGNLAMLLDAHGQDETAAAYYDHAAAHDPRALQWAYLEARALEDVGRTSDAIDAYRAAVSVQPGHQPSRLRLAALLEAEGENDEARELYQSVLELEPISPAASAGLGRLALEAGDLSDGVEHLERAAAGAPDYRPALEGLARAYEAAGRAGDAALFRELAEAQPGDPLPVYADPVAELVESMAEADAAEHVRRGKGLERLGEFSAAVAELEQALRLDPDSQEAHIALLSVYAVQGHFGKAEEHYEAAAQGEKSADLLYNLGILRSLQQRYPEAVQAYREAIRLDPDRADAHSNLGYAYQLLGSPADAERHFRRALELFPLHRLANIHLGRTLLERGNASAAEPLLRRAALIADARAPAVLDLLAEAQTALGKDEEAARSRARAQQLAEEMNLNSQETEP